MHDHVLHDALRIPKPSVGSETTTPTSTSTDISRSTACHSLYPHWQVISSTKIQDLTQLVEHLAARDYFDERHTDTLLPESAEISPTD